MVDRRAPVQLRPFVSAGEVLVRPDGKGYDIVPLSLFRMADGQTAIRIGRNVLFFDRDGRYDGPEGRFAEADGAGGIPRAEAEAIGEAYAACRQNLERRPADAHFAPGSRGYEDETGIWPPPPPPKMRLV